jgi:uncharacterized protein YqeY
MSSLSDKIQGDLTEAMKAKDATRLDALRMLISALKNKMIETGNRENPSDDQVFFVVKSEIKKRRDSIIAYEQGNRRDLADKEAGEIAVLEKYLPAQMDEAEVEKEIMAAIESMGGVGAGDFGRTMGVVMKRIGNRADGNAVSVILRKILAGRE